MSSKKTSNNSVDTHETVDTNKDTDESAQQIEKALSACGFGRFQWRVLLSSLMGVSAALFANNTPAYILAIAECQLHMTLVQKGLLNATSYIGMMVSSVVAGFLTDTFGRKLFLVVGYAGMYCFNTISAFSQSFEVLVTSKFFEGIFFAIAFSPTLTLTSEFCSTRIRSRVLICQCSFTAFSQVKLAFISWAVLTQNWRIIIPGYIDLRNWNIYLLICSAWSLGACILYCFVPESPKYLASKGRFREARKVLTDIYVENTGKPRNTYPCANMWTTDKDKVSAEVKPVTVSAVKPNIGRQIVTGLHNVKPLFRRPLGVYLSLMCTISMTSMAIYNVIRLWFPQLSAILENDVSSGGNETMVFCDLIDAYTQHRLAHIAKVDAVCEEKPVGNTTYINSVLLGLACLATHAVGGAAVRAAGAARLALAAAAASALSLCLIGTGVGGTAVSVGLLVVNGAITKLLISLVETMLVVTFPTSVRTLAISLLLTCGRLGTLVGNLLFPILLGFGCSMPFYTFAVLMLGVGVTTLFIRVKKE